MVLKRVLFECFTMRPDKIPAWRKRWDAVNFTLLAVMIVFILWTTFFH